MNMRTIAPTAFIALLGLASIAGLVSAGERVANPGTAVQTANGTQAATVVGDVLRLEPYGTTGSCGEDGDCSTAEWPPSFPATGTFAVNGANDCNNRMMVYDGAGWQCVGSVQCPWECY